MKTILSLNKRHKIIILAIFFLGIATTLVFAKRQILPYNGQSIGPEGGEVISSDGKVNLVIPHGALSEIMHIRVLSMDRGELKGAVPENKSLLSVVECRPRGLMFNEPVEIVYTLYQAEIPGTPVELGFYDAAQDRIFPTGKTSFVFADGYTVSFFVQHFSTYAALKDG